jgi:hypothetical protein
MGKHESPVWTLWGSIRLDVYSLRDCQIRTDVKVKLLE